MNPDDAPLDLAGMTVNERLFVTGLLDRFDDAARDGNRDLMVQLLMQVGLDEANANESVRLILSSPTRYGRKPA